MTGIQKFRSDIQRIIKHERAENCGRYDMEKVCAKIMEHFEASCNCPGNLSGAVADYWKHRYIDGSAAPDEEPVQCNIDRLAAMLSFLESGGEDEELLDSSDWKELAQLVSYEAESLPIEILQQLMSVLLSKHAV